MNSRNYSRLATVESKTNKARAIKFFFLTIVLLLVLLIFGLPAMAKFAAFLGDFNKSATPLTQDDITPPAPPSIDSLPEATNQKLLDIVGQTEDGAAVTITINREEEEVVSDKGGKFSLKVNLIKGENKIRAKAKDKAGNVGQQTREMLVIFDDQPPNIEISTPAGGASFWGSKQRQIEISGNTDPGSQVTINDRIVVVEDTGNFTFTTTLSEGTNDFLVKSKDKAGNETEKSLSVSFSL